MNMFILLERHCARAARGAFATTAAIASIAACLLVSGCGDGGSSTTASGQPARQAMDGSTAPLGAGGAASAVPIVLMPASGPCAASGTTALQSPQLNSQIDCAP
ncbi:hypothetical protein [Paraburkholderia caffeinilytica]|uniref:hypothetical protein n=1 Tax=Paraburkholderia caffeinilytica TaxID=1761016 RepID=UPI0038BB6194